MRMLSLAAFAVLALTIGAYEEDGMMIIVGVSSALAALASLPGWTRSTFLGVLSDLFAAETILFGLADIVALLGFWPKAYSDYELPRYLPLATALFGVLIFAVSHFPFVRRMMAITDPFFAARTPISIRPWPIPPIALRQSLYARINVFFLILINQFQVALGVRLNFFYRAFGNAIQVPDAAHMGAFWQQLLWIFVPLVTISILAFLVEFYVSLNFVLQWRRWMTASYTSRWLLHSMHYQLAVRGGQTDNPDQRISEDIGGFISGEGGRGTYMNVGIYNYTISAMATATNLVAFSIILWGISAPMDPTIFGVRIPGFLFWVAVIYACFATGMMQLLGRSLSRLMFRQQAVEANFRFDLARIREFSEQIALLKGEDREIDRAGRVFNDVFTTVQRIIRVQDDPELVPPVLFPDLGDHSLCRDRALLFRGEEGRFRHLQPGGRRLLERQLGDELLRQPLHRPRRLQRHDPASDLLRGGFRARPRGRGKAAPDRHRRSDRSDPVDPRPRSQAARRAQARPCRRPRADSAGIDPGDRALWRRQVDVLPSHRGHLVVRQGRNPAAPLRQADAPAAAALHPDRPPARRPRLPGCARRPSATRNCATR